MRQTFCYTIDIKSLLTLGDTGLKQIIENAKNRQITEYIMRTVKKFCVREKKA